MGKRLQLSYAYEAKFYPQYGQNTRKNDLPLKKKSRLDILSGRLGLGVFPEKLRVALTKPLPILRLKSVI